MTRRCSAGPLPRPSLIPAFRASAGCQPRRHLLDVAAAKARGQERGQCECGPQLPCRQLHGPGPLLPCRQPHGPVPQLPCRQPHGPVPHSLCARYCATACIAGCTRPPQLVAWALRRFLTMLAGLRRDGSWKTFWSGSISCAMIRAAASAISSSSPVAGSSVVVPLASWCPEAMLLGGIPCTVPRRRGVRPTRGVSGGQRRPLRVTRSPGRSKQGDRCWAAHTLLASPHNAVYGVFCPCKAHIRMGCLPVSGNVIAPLSLGCVRLHLANHPSLFALADGHPRSNRPRRRAATDSNLAALFILVFRS